MFDAINAEAIYRRQRLSRDWRKRSAGRGTLPRNQSTRVVPDPVRSRRIAPADPASAV